MHWQYRCPFVRRRLRFEFQMDVQHGFLESLSLARCLGEKCLVVLWRRIVIGKKYTFLPSYLGYQFRALDEQLIQLIE